MTDPRPRDGRRTALGAASVLLALLLAACGAPGGPPLPDVHAVAGTDRTVPVAVLALPAGGQGWARIDIPSPLRGGELRLTVEADGAGLAHPLDLVLYGPDGVVPAASTSGGAYFRPGLTGIGEGFAVPGSGAASDRAVTVVEACLGPCVSRRVPTTLDSVFVRLTNPGPAAAEVPLHVFVGEFIDSGEPLNDDRTGAVTVSRETPYRGALERLGDVDWVHFSESGTVTLEERDGYPMATRMRLFGPAPGGGVVDLGITVAAGGSVDVVAGDYGLVHSHPLDLRASVFGFYVVEYD